MKTVPVASFWPVLGAAFVAVMLVGCGGDGSDATSEWTVAEGALSLERERLLGDDEDYFFGSIEDVAVDDEGRAYVVDGEAIHAKVVGPDGELEQTIGKEGDGPGEFLGLRAAHLARGDSLYLLGLRRLSVFSPEARTVARTIPIEMPPKHGLFSVHVPENRGDLLMAFHPWWGTDGPIGLYRVGSGGAPADSPLVRMPPEEWVARMKGGVPGPASRIPFGRAPDLALGPDGHIYQGYSDSLAVNLYSQDGTRRDRWVLPFEPVPVPDSTIDERLSSAGELLRPLLEEAGIPDTKPAFDDFLADDEGRIWFKRPTEDPDRADWWVATPEEKHVSTATLPADVDILAVAGGSAYARTVTKDGAPALVQYRVGIDRSR